MGKRKPVVMEHADVIESLCGADSAVVVVRAAAAADERGILAEPAEVVINRGRIVSVSPPREGSDRTDGRSVFGGTLDLSHCVLLPGLVNAHTHLDLTDVGLVPLGEGGDASERFGGWLARVRAARLTEPELVRQSVLRGAQLARRGGTAFIGDIAGGDAAVVIAALRESGLGGIAFAEVFGLGHRQAASVAVTRELIAVIIPQDGGFRLGLQPHAPYSAGPDVFRHCAAESARLGVPVATHLAESAAEDAFTRSAAGPLADRLRMMGVWNDGILSYGASPVASVLSLMSGTRLLAVHVNAATDQDIELLAQAGATAVYCPRAAAFFGHCDPPDRPHPWRRMVAAGVNVALGTDGLVCLDRADRISVLDDLRFLMEHDHGTAQELLPLCTAHGARALGLPEASVRLEPAGRSGMFALLMDDGPGDPLTRALRGGADPVWIVSPRDPWESE